MSVNWKKYSLGLVGEFPQGPSLFITAEYPSPSWSVRFGTTQIPRKFYDVEEAKQAGILLARGVLTGCLKHLSDDPMMIKEMHAKSSGG